MRDIVSRVTLQTVMLVGITIFVRVTAASYNEHVCPSIDVRNHVSFLQQLRGCTVVEGSVQIVLLEKSNESDFANTAFPELREITHYLLVWRVHGLKSLGQLFPNLSLIRGSKLFQLNAALAIYENHNLQEIGLSKLTNIVEGSVIIYKNINLCFANSIDWDVIMKSNMNQTYYEVYISQNKDSTEECHNQEICAESQCERNLCWTHSQCQILHLNGCHPLCAGGCFSNDDADACYACKGLLTSQNKCVATCPPGSYEYLKRVCVTEEECRQKMEVPQRNSNLAGRDLVRFIPFNGSCVSECPSNYRKSKNNDSCVLCDEKNPCYKMCTAPLDETTKLPTTIRITSISETHELISCTVINGSLALEGLTGNYNAGMEKVLERNLGMIETIYGQLKIVHSHALVSLHFFRNLRHIKGDHAKFSHKPGLADEQPQHTLVVKDNKNLQKLLDWDRRPKNSTLRISSGMIFFHFNPKLCLSEINKLISEAQLATKITNLDVSRESNGDQTTCNASPLNVTVEKTAPNSVILALHTKEKWARFMVFYKASLEKRFKPSEQFESVNECGDDQWRVTNDAESNSDNGTYYILVPHLEPAVRYVFFVRLLYSASAADDDYDGDGGGSREHSQKSAKQYSAVVTSDIHTFVTLPAQPSVPLNLKVNATSDSSFGLTWEPPDRPHGTLQFYTVRGYVQPDLRADLLSRDYCVDPMSKETLSTKPVTSTTTTQPTAPAPAHATGTVDGCNCNTTATAATFARKTRLDEGKWCNAFDRGQNAFEIFNAEHSPDICDTYLYEMIEAKKHSLELSVEDQPLEWNEWKGEAEDARSIFPNQNRKGPDGRYETFSFKVNANATFIAVSNLRHFSEYVVLVAACPEGSTAIAATAATDAKAIVPCSRNAVITVRTQHNLRADRVKKERVNVHVTNRTANISWEEPGLVNSFVHSYNVGYRVKNVDNVKFEDKCVTANRWRKTNGTYTLPNLPAGEYELRVRAISLYGEGEYAISSFTVEEADRSAVSAWLVGVLIALMVMMCVAGLFYYWRMRVIKNRILFASVNPRYEPVYIEDHWEVPRENIVLVKQLGRGTFGSVHEGVLQPGDRRCAVKTTTAAVGEEDNMIFLKEATLMKEFHRAHHIVKLIGVVSKGSPVYVIMELMERGDLKSFLLCHGGQYCDKRNMLPEAMVLKMAAQIADGMAFLEAKKFVHRDLAARNCMVAADNTIKIGDFGLARDIYETDYYRKGDKGVLPIRWMAPESIRDGIFTSNSDVWSFGVVLWEITMLAQMPYHPRTNEEVIKYVQAGRVLDVPINAHHLLKPMMRLCWRWHATQRPKFLHLLKVFEAYMDSSFRDVSFFHNGENPHDPDNVIPSSNLASEDCYVYNDENNEVNIFFPSSSSGAPASALSAVKYIPTTSANGHVEISTLSCSDHCS